MSKADARADKKGGEKRGIKRDRSTQKRLKLYSQRPIRDKGGKIIYQAYQSHDKSHQARIEPNRKWFGPVRTVTQTELNTFREELKNQQSQPYQYLLRSSKVPYSLLRDSEKEGKANLLEVESFDSTFGKKSTRKRPRLNSYSLADLASSAETKAESYSKEEDVNLPKPEDYKEAARDVYFSTGQSNRIWNELFKVVDSSDVIVQVIDARDPVGTRCGYIESHIKKNCPHKHLVLVMNKCDLIPTWAAKRWLHELGKEYPTLAFHASLTKSFGKGALISLLRQFQNIHKDQPQISVGFIGYPNVGKSSVINTLRQKAVCKTAPIPGETKVWQYITLYKKIFLIDCPGVVTPGKDETEADIVLKGVLRVENIPDPSQYIPELMNRVKKEHLQKTYDIYEYDDAEDFLEKFSYKSGKLLKKGEPDMNTSAKMILNDWIRGKIPYFHEPPNMDFPADEEKLEFIEGQNLDELEDHHHDDEEGNDQGSDEEVDIPADGDDDEEEIGDDDSSEEADGDDGSEEEKDIESDD